MKFLLFAIVAVNIVAAIILRGHYAFYGLTLLTIELVMWAAAYRLDLPERHYNE